MGSAGQWNWTMYIGRDFNRTITLYTDEAQTTAKDLTGYSNADMKIKNDAGDTELAHLNSAGGQDGTLTLGGSAGTIVVALSDTFTATLTAQKNVQFDLVLEDASNVKEEPILAGDDCVIAQPVTDV